ncbi:hypothetical protein Droror1_Dr00017008 [Drosera rotundifolia]
MSDAAGLVQFMNAVAELARGEQEPSVLPVWNRELLSARNPPRVTCKHVEYDEVEGMKGTIIPLNDMAQRSFFFGPTEVSALRRYAMDRFVKELRSLLKDVPDHHYVLHRGC